MEGELKINISNQNGQSIQITALDSDNLQVLKLLAYSNSGITISGCDFSLNGRLLENSSSSLKELGVNDQDFLMLEKRNTQPAISFNIPSDINSNEISFESMDEEQVEEEICDFSNQEYELQLKKEFSFAPKLTRQYAARY